MSKEFHVSAKRHTMQVNSNHKIKKIALEHVSARAPLGGDLLSKLSAK